MAEYRLCFRGNISFFLNNASPPSCYPDSETLQLIVIWSFINCFTPKTHPRGQQSRSTIKSGFLKGPCQNFKIVSPSTWIYISIPLILIRNCATQINLLIQRIERTHGQPSSFSSQASYMVWLFVKKICQIVQKALQHNCSCNAITPQSCHPSLHILTLMETWMFIPRFTSSEHNTTYILMLKFS